jgi:hypothetical protein
MKVAEPLDNPLNVGPVRKLGIAGLDLGNEISRTQRCQARDRDDPDFVVDETMDAQT